MDPSTERVGNGHIGHRYQVRALLGHGGMARVYHVFDEITGHELALKQWHAGSVGEGRTDARARKQSVAQFEYEYLTLAQLGHPCMIEVYDYGLHEHGPYFTMELLDGGDLREHAPLPWRRACHVFYDVCSSLALLHSRRLIHRDISPRNIRCTRHGGAKLIDFGAMLPMGLCEQVVGTPAFAAPEVVQGLPLDARVDLFSVGASLYFALTGKQPSGARDFSEVLEQSQTKPLAPSQLTPDVPEGLDSLVLSMLDPDPTLRPRSAFEVMQRLAAIAELPGREPLRVTQAYLTTPELVGRDAVLTRVRERCAEALVGRGGSVALEGQMGMGRSRVLDVCALWAKTLGANVLRGRGGALAGSERPLWHKLAEQLMAVVSRELGQQLRNAEPDFDALFEDVPRSENTAVLAQGQRTIRLRSARSTGLTRRREQLAVQRSLLTASQRTPLVIAVDDVHTCDAESIALLAELAQEAPSHPLLLLVTHDAFAAPSGEQAPWQYAHHTRYIHERAERIALTPLSREQTARLFSSVFGDVPHVALLADRVQAVSAGNPGASLELAQSLVDRGLLRYEAGCWTLPSSLEVADLPACAADSLRARLSGLSPLSRQLATTQALALHDGFTRADYHALAADPGLPEGAVESALAELLGQRVLEAEHGTYTLTQSAWTKVLIASLSESEQRQRHELLAAHCTRKRKPALHLVHHLLCAGEEAAAIDGLLESLQDLGDNLDFELFATVQASPEQTASILVRCLNAACAQARPRWQEHLLRRWLTMLSVLTRDEYYLAAAPGWRVQLEHDAGLSGASAANQNGRTDDHDGMALLRRAERRHAHTPEHERVYSPAEALRHLVSYVSCSLAVAGRRLDSELTASLPGLLEPFADLAPEIHAVWQIALGAEQSLCRCQMDQARARWLEVHAYLSQLPASTLDHLSFIRNAVAYAIGATEVSMGMQSAARWPDELDRDPLHSVNAMYLRRLLRLQLGDFEGAERFRRKAELLSLSADTTQMFTSTIVMELVVHGIGGDLLGVKQLSERIAPLAEHSPSWIPYQALALGYFERLRGNPTAALSAFERCLELSAPSSAGHFGFAWPLATAGLAEVLLDLGHCAQAARLAGAGLARCRKGGVLWLSHMVVRALALAEAKLGHHAHAASLLEASIEGARVRGVSGLPLGSLYEARAFVAIEAGDGAAVSRYAQLTAREYRYGLGSSLGARCERLLEAAARKHTPLAQPMAAAWGGTLNTPPRIERVTQLGAEVSRAMHGAEQAEGRALRALRLLCESHGAEAGHLYLATTHGLRWAASHGVATPEPQLLELAATQLHADLRQRADITRVSGDTQLRLEDSRSQLSDANGSSLEPRVLHCLHAGSPRCAGIALLARTEAPPRPTRPAQFASAIGAYLIDSGEAAGI